MNPQLLNNKYKEMRDIYNREFVGLDIEHNLELNQDYNKLVESLGEEHHKLE